MEMTDPQAPLTDPSITAYRNRLAFGQLWDAIRTCELNVLFHRARARKTAKQARALDIATTLLAGTAGVGILSGIKGVPDRTWAIIALISGLLGQLRAIFQLTDRMLENMRLDNEYSSVVSALSGIVSSCKEARALTPEINGQLKLTLERFRVTNERDQTDYDPDEILPFEDQVKKMYPKDRLWSPSDDV